MLQGEPLALEWSDINLKGATLSVQRSLVEFEGEFTTSEPKTDKARRTVTLPAIAVEALAEHRKQMLTEGLAGSSRLFTMPDGKPIKRDWLLRFAFRPILKAAGLPAIRFHDLRHSVATLLFSQECHPKVVQERLGHSSIQITLDTYSHAVPSIQREAAEKFDTFFSREAESA